LLYFSTRKCMEQFTKKYFILKKINIFFNILTKQNFLKSVKKNLLKSMKKTFF
jgi:hypothetical protein